MAESERPILFSGPMVRALLEGRKTQTRRVVKPQPAPNQPHDGGTTWHFDARRGVHVPCGSVGHLSVKEKGGLACPYGQPGDRLWVRETWAPHADELQHYSATTPASASIYYQADGGLWGDDDMRAGRGWFVPGDPHVNRWHPSIHMPRWASRLTLEVTGVRVERLQDISESDARAEGVARNPAQEGTWLDYPAGTSAAGWKDPQRSFQSLWETINGPDSWAANPWVWVVEFRRVEAAR